jgi:hypothetical protein
MNKPWEIPVIFAMIVISKATKRPFTGEDPTA